MNRFGQLYAQLVEPPGGGAALAAYLRAAPKPDVAWAVHLLLDRRPTRWTTAPALLAEVADGLGVDAETLAQCAAQVGDAGETIALLVDTLSPPDPAALPPTLAEVMRRLKPRQDLAAAAKWVTACGLSLDARLVLIKLLTGTLRAPTAEAGVVRGIATAFGVRAPVVAHRLMGRWAPMPDFEAWLAKAGDAAPSEAYPFTPRAPLTPPLAEPSAWQIEWTLPGAQVQLIRRAGEVYLWTVDGEMIAKRCPEITLRALPLPDGTVIVGRLFAGQIGAPLPEAALQRRLTRKTAPASLQTAAPLCFIAEDLFEDDGLDQRPRPLADRRARLQARLAEMIDPFALVPALAASSWADVQALHRGARAQGALGLTLRGDAQILEWPAAALQVIAVLIYGEARRSGPTRYTVGVWSGDLLVPIAKPTQGLDAKERARLDRWIRAETTERFGPVRSVPGVQVFEIAFDQIDPSGRHAAGLVLRGARIVNWRGDLSPADAHTLAHLEALIP